MLCVCMLITVSDAVILLVIVSHLPRLSLCFWPCTGTGAVMLPDLFVIQALYKSFLLTSLPVNFHKNRAVLFQTGVYKSQPNLALAFMGEPQPIASTMPPGHRLSTLLPG